MKKVAVIFVLAVFVPSLVLAWLAVRSLRDQQFLLERQQSLLYQGVADATAKQVQDKLAEYQRGFADEVAALLRDHEPRDAAQSFDELLRKEWPLAQVGFVVTSTGDILSPSRAGRPEARAFYAENDRFLANREAAEVYVNVKMANSVNGLNYNGSGQPSPLARNNYQNFDQQSPANIGDPGRMPAQQQASSAQGAAPRETTLQAAGQANPVQLDTGTQVPASGQQELNPVLNNVKQIPRSVTPQYQSRPSINSFRSLDNSLQTLFRTNSFGNPQPQASGQNLNNSDNNQLIQSKVPPAPNPSPRQQFDANAGANPGANSFNETRLNTGNFLPQARNQTLQQQAVAFQNGVVQEDNEQQFSKVSASEAEFRQLIGDDNEGTLARFVDNKLSVLFWRRSPRDPGLIFGASLALPRLVEDLRPLLEQIEPALQEEICVALLDDLAKPAALSHPGFRALWKRPLVATEIGESLPHWEVAVYPLDPAKLSKSAQTLKLTLGLLIGVLVLAIGVGSWLIVTDLNRHLTLARQKTDFVSNVSHELKTPLTSIRMFSELLAEGRVSDPARQRSYLSIITSETARLTRLINNVLDFARLERGEKKYHFQKCDVVDVARDTAESYRPHLETSGFQFDCSLPDAPAWVNGDRDALAQVVVNLLSNAEKYSDGCKEITVRVSQQTSPLPHVEIQVLDRGMGVPAGCGEKIFEKFYRAHDSLNSGIQGSGLGLTLARQIARAHGGEVDYEPRAGGGSCFILRLPRMLPEQNRNPKSDPPSPGFGAA